MHNRIGHRFQRRLDVPVWIERRPQGAPLSSPLDIPGLIAWYAARLEAYADNDSIQTATDQSGNGRNATAAVGPESPTYKTGIINGEAVYRFDGVAELMHADAVGVLLTGDNTPFSIYFAGEINAAANFKYIWSIGNSGNDTPWHALQSRTGIGYSSLRNDDIGVAANLSPGANDSTVNPFIHGTIMTGGANTQGRNNGAVTFGGNSATPNDMTVDRFGIANLRRIGGIGQIAIDLAEMVIVDHALTDEERDFLETYLNGFYAAY